MNIYSLACTKEHSAQHRQRDSMSQDDLLCQHVGDVALSQRSQGDIICFSLGYVVL